jgi:hypothetical protein
MGDAVGGGSWRPVDTGLASANAPKQKGKRMDQWKPKKQFAPEEVEAAMARKGGFSRESLAKLGVPWPPPSGWRRAITKRPEIPSAIMDDARTRTPEEWYALIPKLAHWAFKGRTICPEAE